MSRIKLHTPKIWNNSIGGGEGHGPTLATPLKKCIG